MKVEKMDEKFDKGDGAATRRDQRDEIDDCAADGAAEGTAVTEDHTVATMLTAAEGTGRKAMLSLRRS